MNILGYELDTKTIIGIVIGLIFISVLIYWFCFQPSSNTKMIQKSTPPPQPRQEEEESDVEEEELIDDEEEDLRDDDEFYVE